MSSKILAINIRGLPSGYRSNLTDANVFQDYDAVVVKPESHYDIYGDVEYIRQNQKTITRNCGWSFLDINNRRRNEARALLERGGVLVCLLQPIDFAICYLYKDEKRGPSYISNYDWLLRQTDLRDEIGDIEYSHGDTIDHLDNSHPFFDYLKSKPSWSAYIDQASCTNWRVLASAFGTHVVSLAKRVGLGHLIFIPSGYSDENGEILEQCILKLIKDKEVATEPDWAEALSVFGQEDIRSKIEELNGEILSLEKEREVLIAKNHDLEHWKWLLYAKGKHQLQPIVQEALKLIGFKVEDQPDEDSDGLVTSEFGCALLEVVGSTGNIKIEKFGELVKNIGNFIIKQEGRQVKGILVGNPFCEKPLENRPPKDSQKQLFAKELIASAEKQDITVLLSTDLYELISKILASEVSEKQKVYIRQNILQNKGLLRLSQLL